MAATATTTMHYRRSAAAGTLPAGPLETHTAAQLQTHTRTLAHKHTTRYATSPHCITRFYIFFVSPTSPPTPANAAVRIIPSRNNTRGLTNIIRIIYYNTGTILPTIFLAPTPSRVYRLRHCRPSHTLSPLQPR